MIILYTSSILSTLTAIFALTSALPTLNITGGGSPEPWPWQPILCWNHNHATHVPLYSDCIYIIDKMIATGPDPGRPIMFSRFPPVNNCPKRWLAPRRTCSVDIDVRFRSFDKASLTEIQATARSIVMKCVLGNDKLGGTTTIGQNGNIQVTVLGHYYRGDGVGNVSVGTAATAALGAGLWKVTPNHRPFTLTDPTISFPYVEHEKVSTTTLFLVSLVAPAIIIFLVALIFTPGHAVAPGTPKSLIWRRKLWEWHTGWLGLGLSLALAFFFTQGMKNMFGKPRPDLLSRCDPDFENQAKYQLGGFPTVLNGMFLVSSTICRQKDKGILNDGFSSFPSGHCSYSFAGLLYLSLFLASKLRFTIPYLLPFTHTASNNAYTGFSSTTIPTTAASKPHSNTSSPPSTSYTNPRQLSVTTPLRDQSAAPPLYLFPIPLIPFCAAIYIASTRFSDFRHHGFDILFGSLMGSVIAIFTFRLYHLPINRGGGWAWGARGPRTAFWTGIGTGGYVVEETKKRDVEEGFDFGNGKGSSEHGGDVRSGVANGGVQASNSTAIAR
ncbi:MAG: hypothetical protein Q9218_005973 [Villophora microphyllina]